MDDGDSDSCCLRRGRGGSGGGGGGGELVGDFELFDEVGASPSPSDSLRCSIVGKCVILLLLLFV